MLQTTKKFHIGRGSIKTSIRGIELKRVHVRWFIGNNTNQGSSTTGNTSITSNFDGSLAASVGSPFSDGVGSVGEGSTGGDDGGETLEALTIRSVKDHHGPRLGLVLALCRGVDGFAPAEDDLDTLEAHGGGELAVVSG